MDKLVKKSVEDILLNYYKRINKTEDTLAYYVIPQTYGQEEVKYLMRKAQSEIHKRYNMKHSHTNPLSSLMELIVGEEEEEFSLDEMIADIEQQTCSNCYSPRWKVCGELRAKDNSRFVVYECKCCRQRKTVGRYDGRE